MKSRQLGVGLITLLLSSNCVAQVLTLPDINLSSKLGKILQQQYLNDSRNKNVTIKVLEQSMSGQISKLLCKYRAYDVDFEKIILVSNEIPFAIHYLDEPAKVYKPFSSLDKLDNILTKQELDKGLNNYNLYCKGELLSNESYKMTVKQLNNYGDEKDFVSINSLVKQKEIRYYDMPYISYDNPATMFEWRSKTESYEANVFKNKSTKSVVIKGITRYVKNTSYYYEPKLIVIKPNESRKVSELDVFYIKDKFEPTGPESQYFKSWNVIQEESKSAVDFYILHKPKESMLTQNYNNILPNIATTSNNNKILNDNNNLGSPTIQTNQNNETMTIDPVVLVGSYQGASVKRYYGIDVDKIAGPDYNLQGNYNGVIFNDINSVVVINTYKNIIWGNLTWIDNNQITHQYSIKGYATKDSLYFYTAEILSYETKQQCFLRFEGKIDKSINFYFLQGKWIVDEKRNRKGLKSTTNFGQSNCGSGNFLLKSN